MFNLGRPPGVLGSDDQVAFAILLVLPPAADESSIRRGFLAEPKLLKELYDRLTPFLDLTLRIDDDEEFTVRVPWDESNAEATSSM